MKEMQIQPQKFIPRPGCELQSLPRPGAGDVGRQGQPRGAGGRDAGPAGRATWGPGAAPGPVPLTKGDGSLRRGPTLRPQPGLQRPERGCVWGRRPEQVAKGPCGRTSSPRPTCLASDTDSHRRSPHEGAGSRRPCGHGQAANEKGLPAPRPALRPRGPRGPRACRVRPRPAARATAAPPQRQDRPARASGARRAEGPGVDAHTPVRCRTRGRLGHRHQVARSRGGCGFAGCAVESGRGKAA